MNVNMEATSVDFPAERLQKVAAALEEKGSAKITELAADLRVSESTVRRDLDILAQEGRIRRTHGGAIWLSPRTGFEQVFSQRLLICGEEKKRIGEACAAMVQDGDTLFLDSGTTTFQVAQALRGRKNLTIFTYDLTIASLGFDPSTNVVVTGGTKREEYNVVVGSFAEEFITRIRFDTLFLSADAVDREFGVSNLHLPEVFLKTKLCKSAQRVVLAADSSKFGKMAVAKICELSDLDCMVTDNALSARLREEILSRVKDYKLV